MIAPQWIKLIPAGRFVCRDGRGPFTLEDPMTVIRATAELRMTDGVPIDYDHATDFAAQQGNPAPAAGWLREFEVRNGAIWGRCEWTERGARALRDREYRYLSPVFQHDKNSGHVMRILRAGLTNNPNLYLPAISAADSGRGLSSAATAAICAQMGIAPADYARARMVHAPRDTATGDDEGETRLLEYAKLARARLSEFLEQQPPDQGDENLGRLVAAAVAIEAALVARDGDQAERKIGGAQ